MSSEVAEATQATEKAVDRLAAIDHSQMEAAELLGLVRDVERLQRRLSAVADDLAGAVERTAAHAVDGHRSAKACLKHLARLPGAEAAARVRTARALRGLPRLAAGYADGTIPSAHVRLVGRVAANPRVTDFLDESFDETFAAMAAETDYDTFRHALASWERLADADGAAEATEAARARRAVSLRQLFNGTWALTGTLPALEGAAVAETLARYERNELDADLAGAEPGTPLARTPAQRRADAFVVALSAAAGAEHDRTGRPIPLVNVIVDQATLEDEICRTTSPDRTGEPPAPAAELVERRCQTLDGHPLAPADALAATVIGQLRRVLIDSKSTVVDLGRRSRLYRGPAREIIWLRHAIENRAGPLCAWPGCDTGRHYAHVDHIEPWIDGGATTPDNGQLLCPTHNRQKATDPTATPAVEPV